MCVCVYVWSHNRLNTDSELVSQEGLLSNRKAPYVLTRFTPPPHHQERSGAAATSPPTCPSATQVLAEAEWKCPSAVQLEATAASHQLQRDDRVCDGGGRSLTASQATTGR